MSTQIVFTVDPNTCIKCKTCEMSCNEYYGLSGIHRRKVLTFKTETGNTPMHISISCTHCLNPVCVYVCPENNYQKRRDGIVVLDANGCKGCRKCIEACPVQAPKMNPHTNRVDKCNFCVERISDDLRPVCIENCITGALGMMTIETKEFKRIFNNLGKTPIKNYSQPALVVLNNETEQLHIAERR